MRRIRLFLFSSALVVTLLGVLSFVGLSITSAQTTQSSHSQASTGVTQPSRVQVACSGNGCNGLNPVTAGCDADAYTVQTAVFSNSYVELRYSRTCGTNWGRVTSKVGPTYLVIRTQRIDGLTYTFAGGNYNYAWAAMVYAPQAKARACGGVNGISGCTAYV